MIPKNATPVERILASLDEESAEAENYSASEIELLPIAEIETRLDELGIGSSLSPYIKGVAFGYGQPFFVPSPAYRFPECAEGVKGPKRLAALWRLCRPPSQKVIDALSEDQPNWLQLQTRLRELSHKVIDALSEDQDGQDDEIERLPLERVTVKLNNAGLNYLAGLERVRELVGATAEYKKEDGAKPASHDEKRKIFERHFLLGKLSGDEIDTLLHYARVERYPAGREVFSKGSAGASMMAVLRGTLKMSSVSPEGKEVVFNLMNPGDCFGEITLLDGEARSTDAVAMNDCELLVLQRRDFMPILEKRADICLILLKVLCQRLRQTTEQVEDVLFRHLESRVAKALVHLAESVGLHGVRGPSVEIHVCQRELGNMAGGSRESVNKHLQIWHRQGLIDLSRGSIIIRDVEAIKRLAGYAAKGMAGPSSAGRTLLSDQP
jgi:CRP/FNR family cyclic AMP-dependent transcriptional regulator